MEPVVQGNFVHGINNDIFEQQVTLDGTVATSASLVVLTSGVTKDATAFVQTKRKIKHAPGEGGAVRGAMIYGSASAGTVQFFGAENSENAFLIGYRNLDFGALHGVAGKTEIRSLQVTDPCATTEITVTLSGGFLGCARYGRQRCDSNSIPIIYSGLYWCRLRLERRCYRR